MGQFDFAVEADQYSALRWPHLHEWSAYGAVLGSDGPFHHKSYIEHKAPVVPVVAVVAVVAAVVVLECSKA